jgi:hypothetical protein
MRAFVPRSLAFALATLIVTSGGQALAQTESAAGTTAAAEPPEELTVRGGRTPGAYRLELERQRNEIFRIFNEANKGDDTDIRCKNEQPTGSRMRQTVCRSKAENEANAAAAQSFLVSLFTTSGGFRTNARLGTAAVGTPGALAGGGQLNSSTGTKDTGDVGDALAQWEAEWNRLLTENRDLYNAVVRYAELDDAYAQARGATAAPLPDLIRGAPSEQSAGPACEASTLTEYSQRNDVALVSGTVSISGCPAGTTGGFTVVARVRDDDGNTNPLEFKETWQRADAEDHVFKTEYPIGDNVFLSSVRVRDLECTCAAPAQ